MMNPEKKFKLQDIVDMLSREIREGKFDDIVSKDGLRSRQVVALLSLLYDSGIKFVVE